MNTATNAGSLNNAAILGQPKIATSPTGGSLVISKGALGTAPGTSGGGPFGIKLNLNIKLR